MSNVKLYSYKKLMLMRIKEFSSEWDPCRADKELMHMCVQEFSPVSGGWVHAKFKGYPRTKSSESRNCLQVWRGGMYKRKGNTRQRVNAHADSRIFVSGGTILDENFISGQIVNAHADSRFSLVSRGGVRLGVMSVPNKKCFGFLRPDQIVPKPFICLYYCNRLNKTYTSSYSRKLHSFRAIHRIISWEMCL